MYLPEISKSFTRTRRALSHPFLTPLTYPASVFGVKINRNFLSRGSTKNQIEKMLILRVEMDILVACVKNWFFYVHPSRTFHTRF